MNNESYYTYAMLIPILVPIILLIINAHYSKTTASSNVIKCPNFMTIIGIVDCALFITLYILSTLQDTKFPLYTDIILLIITSLLVLLGLSCVFLGLNYKLILNDNDFIHINFWGIKKTYKYSEITAIYMHYSKNTKTPNKYDIYIKKKRITIEYLMINFGIFEELIKKRLRTTKNKIKIEVARKNN